MFGDESWSITTPSEEHTFEQSRMNELEGLKSEQFFEVLKRSSVPYGAKIHKTKWVDSLKTKDDGTTHEKSRLVAQNFHDPGAASIATRSPTVTRLSQRLVLTSAAMMQYHATYVRDISQAYIQSETKLECSVYLEAPKEMNLDDDEVLIARKPLYGIPESGLPRTIRIMSNASR